MDLNGYIRFIRRFPKISESVPENTPEKIPATFSKIKSGKVKGASKNRFEKEKST